jgi:hypothetical protein
MGRTGGMGRMTVLPSCHFIGAAVLIATMIAACGGGTMAPAVTTAVSSPSTGPPQPSNGATIAVTSTGFSIREVHILQGSRLTFVNDDIVPHDIMSDPFHVHTDCPELNIVGFLTPGQSRASDPLDAIRTCGFHDHDHEGDERFHGMASIEAR